MFLAFFRGRPDGMLFRAQATCLPHCFWQNGLIISKTNYWIRLSAMKGVNCHHFCDLRSFFDVQPICLGEITVIKQLQEFCLCKSTLKVPKECLIHSKSSLIDFQCKNNTFKTSWLCLSATVHVRRPRWELQNLRFPCSPSWPDMPLYPLV